MMGTRSRSIAAAAGILTFGAVAVLFLIVNDSGSDLAVPKREVSRNLVSLNELRGKELLFESEANAAFLPLISHFETQETQTLCGPTSIAMVLNALEVPAPLAEGYGAYRLFTQGNVVNALTADITTYRRVPRSGMALSTVARVLQVYGVFVEVHYASETTVERFRSLAAQYLRTPGRHVIVNYSRAALGQLVSDTFRRSAPMMPIRIVS
jgi:hypothetical protein